MNAAQSNHKRPKAKHSAQGGAHTNSTPRRGMGGIVAVLALVAVLAGGATAYFMRNQNGGVSGTPKVEDTVSKDEADKKGTKDGEDSKSADAKDSKTADAKAADDKDSKESDAKDDASADVAKGDGKDSKDSSSTATDSSKASSPDAKGSAGASNGGSSALGSGSGTGSASGSAASSAVAEPTFAEPTYVEPTEFVPTVPPVVIGTSWMTGEACASDVAESGTETASLIPFDDSIPQVAVENAPGASDYFGRYLEIRYEGKVVKAQVVDCGAYHAGSTGIMLNPAVFREFGVTSVDEWGRRMVEYRLV